MKTLGERVEELEEKLSHIDKKVWVLWCVFLIIGGGLGTLGGLIIKAAFDKVVERVTIAESKNSELKSNIAQLKTSNDEAEHKLAAASATFKDQIKELQSRLGDKNPPVDRPRQYAVKSINVEVTTLKEDKERDGEIKLTLRSEFPLIPIAETAWVGRGEAWASGSKRVINIPVPENVRLSEGATAFIECEVRPVPFPLARHIDWDASFAATIEYFDREPIKLELGSFQFRTDQKPELRQHRFAFKIQPP